MGNDLGNRLEPPKLGFRRKKEKAGRTPADDSRDERTEPAEETPDTADTARLEPVDDDRWKPKEPGEEPTQVLPAQAAGPEQAAEPEHPGPDEKPAKAGRVPKPPKAPRPARELPLDGHTAAAVTGLVVGLWLVVSVWGCEQLSQAARGTTSLGRAGFPLLLGIFVIGVVGGGLLLRAFGTPSPFSIGFLGTGLVSVLSILFLTDHVDSLWGAVVIVVLAVASFVLARWVSVRYIDAT